MNEVVVILLQKFVDLIMAEEKENRSDPKTENRTIRFTKEGWDIIQKSAIRVNQIVEPLLLKYIEHLNKKIKIENIILESLLSTDSNYCFSLSKNSDGTFLLDINGNKFSQLTPENVRFLLVRFQLI